jgi:hypothetical protein
MCAVIRETSDDSCGARRAHKRKSHGSLSELCKIYADIVSIPNPDHNPYHNPYQSVEMNVSHESF